MEITATELKLNLGKYLAAANEEPVTITKNGKAIAQLIGLRAYKYDFSELEEFDRHARAGAGVLEEAIVSAYGALPENASDSADADTWRLTRNGEPVAHLMPVLKQKKKRRIGFVTGPPVSDETEAALFESEWTDEEYEEWLNHE
jgi:prevent-host-death family protein